MKLVGLDRVTAYNIAEFPQSTRSGLPRLLKAALQGRLAADLGCTGLSGQLRTARLHTTGQSRLSKPPGQHVARYHPKRALGYCRRDPDHGDA